jgi:hypothetical protein
LDRYGIDICCLQETKILGDSSFDVGGYRFWNVGSDCHHGLGFFVRKDIGDRILRVGSIGTQGNIALLQIKISKNLRLSIINAHAPTKDKDVDQHDVFYEALADSFQKVKNDALVYICGDFNAVIGTQRPNETCIGRHPSRLHDRNDPGQRLVTFCETQGLFICNSAFEQSERRKATHTGTSCNEKLYFRQIDYILCRYQMKSLLTQARTYGGTFVTSDHRLLAARMDLPRFYGLCSDKNRRVNQHKVIKYNTTKLNEDEVKDKYQSELCSRLQSIENDLKKSNDEGNRSRYMYKKILASIKDTAKIVLGEKKSDNSKKQKGFVDKELEEMSNLQRKIKLDMESNVNISEAKKREMKLERRRILKKMRKRVNKLRMEEINAKIECINNFKDNAKQFEAIKFLKDEKQGAKKLVVNNSEKERIDNEIEAAEFVRLYFESLFHIRDSTSPEAFPDEPRPMSAPITHDEVQIAINKLKNRKAAGLDGISAELVKYGPPELSQMLADLLNMSLERNEDLGLGVGILTTLLKTGKPVGPVENIRPIVLLPLLRKILSLIVLARMRTPINAFSSSQRLCISYRSLHC